MIRASSDLGNALKSLMILIANCLVWLLNSSCFVIAHFSEIFAANTTIQ